jgi:hypothetical protein
MYLPFSATSTLLLGALIGHFAKPGTRPVSGSAEDPFEPGVLYSSGLIAGGAIAAIAVAVASSFGLLARFDLGSWIAAPLLRSPGWAILVFCGLCALLWRYSRSGERKAR